MMTGIVTADREATLHVIVRGPSGRERDVEAIVDTGFNGFLILSSSSVAELSLVHYSYTEAVLGDGSRITLSKYKAAIIWDGREREVLVLEADGGPLIGMSLLDGHRLMIEVRNGGAVIIDALQP